MKTLRITQRGVLHEVKLDDASYERVAKYSWRAYGSETGRPYFKRTDWTGGADRGRVDIYLHHFVIGAVPKGAQVDHINGDTLDNRLCNLRIATSTQNNANSTRRKDNTSGFKGVYFHKQRKKWCARVHVNHKTISLGMFLDVQDAARAYDVAAKKHFGEFARTNF